MTTEYCNVCGCVVPFCKHTDGHATARLRVCISANGNQIIEVLHHNSLDVAVKHCKDTRKLNPEYPRIVLYQGTTSDTPIVWDSAEDDKQQAALLMMGGVDHPGIDKEMAEAAMMMCGVGPEQIQYTGHPDQLPPVKPERKKAEYKMLNPQIFPATSFRDIPEHKGKFVAMGFMLTSDGDLHDNKTRTSLLVKVDIEAGYIETLNSIYWIV